MDCELNQRQLLYYNFLRTSQTPSTTTVEC